jgi:hypothetical protein
MSKQELLLVNEYKKNQNVKNSTLQNQEGNANKAPGTKTHLFRNLNMVQMAKKLGSLNT